MERLWLSVAGCLVVLAGCGSTIGDACTTPTDCGGQICLNETYTPGGYCSRQCTLADPERTCPTGTACVVPGKSGKDPSCFRVCARQSECRAGYVCERVPDTTRSVCIGPNTLN